MGELVTDTAIIVPGGIDIGGGGMARATETSGHGGGAMTVGFKEKGRTIFISVWVGHPYLGVIVSMAVRHGAEISYPLQTKQRRCGMSCAILLSRFRPVQE